MLRLLLFVELSDSESRGRFGCLFFCIVVTSSFFFFWFVVFCCVLFETFFGFSAGFWFLLPPLTLCRLKVTNLFFLFGLKLRVFPPIVFLPRGFCFIFRATISTTAANISLSLFDNSAISLKELMTLRFKLFEKSIIPQQNLLNVENLRTQLLSPSIFFHLHISSIGFGKSMSCNIFIPPFVEQTPFTT